MYISKNLLILIIICIISVIHIIIHIIIFIKLHNIQGKKPINLTTIKEKGKALITTLLKPDNSIISGIKEFITNTLNSENKEDNNDNG